MDKIFDVCGAAALALAWDFHSEAEATLVGGVMQNNHAGGCVDL
jgi:hypothetical protein